MNTIICRRLITGVTLHICRLESGLYGWSIHRDRAVVMTPADATAVYLELDLDQFDSSLHELWLEETSQPVNYTPGGTR